MSNTFENAITVTVTGIALATSGTSANAALPKDSTGAVPKYIRITATAAACVRIGTGTPVALATDLMVQPGDAVILATCGLPNVAAIQVTAAGVVQISPMENA